MLAGRPATAGWNSVDNRGEIHDHATVPPFAFGEPARCLLPRTYDMLVIGSGEANKYLAWTVAGEGYHTAVVERKLIGGSCPNIACPP